MITPDEALLVLGKWREEKTPLHAVVRFDGFDFGFDCRVIVCSLESIGLDLAGEWDVCQISLSGFRFDYSAPNDLESVKVRERIYPSGLRGFGPRGEVLWLMEIAREV